MTVASCSDIEEIAQSGQLPPDVCTQAVSFPSIVDNCGCVCTPAPTQQPTAAPSTLAPTLSDTTLIPTQTTTTSTPTAVPADTPTPSSTDVPVAPTPVPTRTPATTPIPTTSPVTAFPSKPPVPVPSTAPIRPTKAPIQPETMEPSKEKVPEITTLLCRCERRHEGIYQREQRLQQRPQRNRQWQIIRDIFYNSLSDFDGYVVKNGITILPRNDPACREQHIRSHDRLLKEDATGSLDIDYVHELQISDRMLRGRELGSLREKYMEQLYQRSDFFEGEGKGSKKSKNSKGSKSSKSKTAKSPGRTLVFRCPKRF